MTTVGAEPSGRWAWVGISPGAIRHNAQRLAGAVHPAALWAVVKADGYGHGAATTARAALDGGATRLCVALVQEGIALREAGIEAPVLVLSPQPPEQLAAAVAAGLELTVTDRAGLAAVEATGAGDHAVHLKVDTGMHRVGSPPADVVDLALAVERSPATRLASVWTHLAVADEPADPFTATQLDRFALVRDALGAAGLGGVPVHAANSAGGIAHPRARLDAVRAGIALYGLSPGHDLDDECEALGLRPALTLTSRVSSVARVAAGEGISYGLRHRLEREATVATLPVGYADGVARRSYAVGGAVLIRGARRPIVGVVTMDQLMVDCGDDAVAVGDEAVLIGRQGDAEITATDVADSLGTISYEVVCALSSRLPRRLTP